MSAAGPFAGAIAGGGAPATLRGIARKGCAPCELEAGIAGVLDNGPELAAQLGALGHRPASPPDDADVIAHAYEEWGDAFVARLRGSFALAVRDARAGKLLLARDHAGTRPLYYHEAPGLLAFGSRLDELAAVADFPRELDPVAIDAYLALRTVPAPLCIHRAVRKLPAGHLLSCSGGVTRLERHFAFRHPGSASWPGEEAAIDQLAALLEDAVARMGAADSRGRGLLLSGGPDSGMLLAAAAARSALPRSFCFEFPGGHGEIAGARRTAEHFRAPLDARELDPAVAEALPRIVLRHEEPHGNPSALFWHRVREGTRNEVGTLLCGEGADELFGGRDVHLVAEIAEVAHQLVPGAILGAGASLSARAGRGGAAKLLRGAALPGERRDAYWVSTFTAEARDALYDPAFAARIDRHRLEALAPEPTGRHPLERTFALEVGLLLPELVLATTGGGDGPDVRMPFLDPRIVALAAAQPPSRRVGLRTSKRLLRRLYARRLPPFLQQARRSGGMKVPVSRPLREELRETLHDHLLSPAAQERGHFRRSVVRRMVEEHASGAHDHGARLWPLLMLELWHRRASR